jgi:hypothetical protein
MYSNYILKKYEYSSVSINAMNPLSIFIIIYERPLRDYRQGDRKGIIERLVLCDVMLCDVMYDNDK